VLVTIVLTCSLMARYAASRVARIRGR
jgi:hypothetical protein